MRDALRVPLGSARLAALLGSAAILAALAFLIGVRIGRPFGSGEINAGSYFGPFAQSFERFGFFAVRGVPLVTSPYKPLAEAFAYLSHPPGTAWVLALSGSAEWALRLPTAIGLALSGLLLRALLAPRVGPWPAAASGLLLVVLPVTAFYAQVSYECLVLPVGLLLFLSATRRREASTRGKARAWTALLLAAAVSGAWLDWAFGFWVAGLLVLTARGGLRGTLRTWGSPAVAALLSLGGVCLWMSWARGAPQLTVPDQLGGAAGATLGNRPPLETWVPDALDRLLEGYTLPVLLVALAGSAPVFRRAPRLMSALLLAGLLNAVVFARHSAGHTLYFAYLAPCVAAGVGGWLLVARRSVLLPAAVVALIVCSAGWTTWQVRQRTETEFFRDLGRTLDEASADRDASGRLLRAYQVFYNLRYYYPYYSETPFATRGGTIGEIEALRSAVPPVGVRYLLFEVVERASDGSTRSGALPAPGAWLEAFPSNVQAALQTTLHDPAGGRLLQITSARLVLVP